MDNPFNPTQHLNGSRFFDRHEPYFERYVTKQLGLPSHASDDEICPRMEADLSERQAVGVTGALAVRETTDFTETQQ